MAHDVDVYLKEFQLLREELVTRTNLAYALIAVDLTVLGAGLTVFQALPPAALGLAAVSSFLWLIFMDHASQVYKIAAYISLRLAPELRAVAPLALQWERFLRELDAGGQRTANALYRQGKGSAPKHWITSGASSKYTATLFAGSPPVLLIAFAVSAATPKTHVSLAEHLVELAALLLSFGIWVRAIIRFRHYLHTLRAISAAILAEAIPQSKQSIRIYTWRA
jgi:hypothetical protein